MPGQVVGRVSLRGVMTLVCMVGLAVVAWAQPPAGGAILFEDDFEDGNMDGWSVVEGSAIGWSVVGGELVVTGGGGYRTVVAGDPSWQDVLLELDATNYDSLPEIGMVFRHTTNPYYDYWWTNYAWGNNATRLLRRPSWYIASRYESGTSGVPHHFAVAMQGDRIRCYRDDELIFDVDDDVYTSGRIGLYGWNPSNLHFDNVVVRDLSGDEVPEPATWLLLACTGALGAALRRRRKK